MTDPMTSQTAPAQEPYTADNTTISAAALVARIAALEAQLLAAQKANTDLIKRIVELEHERDRAMLVVACAVSIVSRAEGLATQLHGPVSGYIAEAQVRALATALAPYREGEGE